jgi:VWFA-related protein
MMKAIRVMGAFLAATILSVGLSAEAPPAGSPPQTGQQQQQQTPPTLPENRVSIVPPDIATFKVRVDLVTTDVIVRDSKGQFVSDLKPTDFEVYEDGVKQDVSQMTLFHGGRQFNALTAPPPPTEEGIVLPPSRPTNDAAGRMFVFFVDDLHLDFRNTARVRELFKKIRTSLVHDGDMFGMVSTGPSSIAIDMTYDLKRFDEAVKKIAGNALSPQDILEGGESSDGPNEVRYRAHVAFSTASDLMLALEQVHNRRKALIYVSDGYDFNPFPDSRAKAEADMQGTSNAQAAGTAQDSGAGGTPTDAMDQYNQQNQEFADADLARELSDLTNTANRANVTIYTIDPRGLVGMPDLDTTVSSSEWQDYVRKSIDSLRVLADETGGYAMVNSNDFDRGLKRIDAETSDYYVLGYYSKNPDPLKRNRKIEVKVTRPDLQVWSRKGYTLKKPPKPVPDTKK